jgi:hypothetical protein
MARYTLRWTDVWQPYVLFFTTQDDKHPTRELAFEIRQTSLENDLASLYMPYGTSYYDRIEQFTNLARSVKAQPGNAETLRQLNDLEKELIRPSEDTRKVYKAYAQSLRESDKSLAKVAGYVNTYIGRIKQLQKKPDAEEIKLLKSLLNEVKSISNDLTKDAQAYLTDTAKTLATIKTTV